MANNIHSHRIYWLDYAKVLGIFLVIYGHGGLCGDQLTPYIFSFHMPMFFIVSGMLYKPAPLRDTIIKNWKCLMLPYFLLNFLCYLPQLTFSALKGSLSINSVASNWGAVLLGLGYESNGLVPISTPCWFIYALFLAKLILAMFHRANQTVAMMALSMCAILATILLQTCNIDLLIPFDSTLLAIPFISVGYILKDKIIVYVQKIDVVSIALFFLITALCVYMVKANGRVDMNTCLVGKSLLMFYATGILASAAFLKLCYAIYALFANSKVVMGGVILLSQSTLLYIAFNLTAISYTKILFERLLHVSTDGGYMGLIAVILVFLEHMPLCILAIKKFPILIGKRR